MNAGLLKYWRKGGINRNEYGETQIHEKWISVTQNGETQNSTRINYKFMK